MQKINQKLNNYKKLSSATKSSISKSTNTALRFAATLPTILLGGAYADAQCTSGTTSSPLASGFTSCGSCSFSFDIGGVSGNDFKIRRDGGATRTRLYRPSGHTDLSFFTTGLGRVRKFASGDANPTTTANLATNAYVGNETTGAPANSFGMGNQDGYIIFKQTTTGYYGWIRYKHASNAYNPSIINAGINTTTGSITAGNCSSLPVELISFAAVELNSMIELKWSTASEINNAGFEVQRSKDGVQFENLQFVDGNGNSQETLEYNFIDKDAKLGERYFYRLRQIDFDGKFEFSDIIKASLNEDATVIGDIYPNPSESGQVNVNMNTEEEGDWTISLLDLTGREIATEQRTITTGASKQSFTFDSHLTGIYILRMENGVTRIYKEVVFN
jgi:hypothetical protein